MARKTRAAAKPAAKKRTAAKPAAKKRTARKPAAKWRQAFARAPSFAGYSAAAPGWATWPRAKMMTPEQAIGYTRRIRRGSRHHQCGTRGHGEGAQVAIRRRKRARWDARPRGRPRGGSNALMAAGQSVSQEAVENAMRYWGQMFELVVGSRNASSR